MNINFTLVVQAINFFVAYKLIRTLLLRPAVDAIESDQLVRENQINAIEMEERVITKKNDAINKQWQTCQDHFALCMPPPTSALYYRGRRILFIMPKIPTVSIDHIRHLTTDVAHAIVKEVKDVPR